MLKVQQAKGHGYVIQPKDSVCPWQSDNQPPDSSQLSSSTLRVFSVQGSEDTW